MSIFRRKRRGRSAYETEASVARHIVYGVLSVLLFSACIALIWYLTRLETFTISSVAVTGGETISHDEVRAVAEQELSGNHLLIIPNRFAYLYPRERIVRAINAMPRAHDAVVERTSPREIRIAFEEYIPSALWCAGEGENEQCFFLTGTGYAFGPAPVLRGGSLMRFVGKTGTQLSAGQAIPEERVRRIGELTQTLEEIQKLRIVEIRQTEDNDLDFVIGGGGIIRVTEDFKTQDVVTRLQAVLSSSEFDHLKPGNFNYIDLRFGNKVFVNEELEPQATTTDAVPAGT